MADKKTPTNTTRQATEHPEDFLLAAMAHGSSGAIEIQEAEGQQSFVNSDVLPVKTQNIGGYNTKVILEHAGVKFLDVVEDDPLFQYVELPRGWKKMPTDHPMWSSLLDDRGRKRAAILYKAAFYDRKAFVRIDRRYEGGPDWERQKKDGTWVAIITDCEKKIHKVGLAESMDDAYGKAKVWLDKHHPDWRNPDAYWDE